MIKAFLPAILCLAFMAVLTGRVAANSGFEESIRAIEASVGGRVGVTVIDTETGKTYSHRGDERFAMCSTFKWALAAQVLKDVEDGRLNLASPIIYGREDMVSYAPAAEKNLAKGQMTIGELASAAVSLSDNVAANLLLEQVGGPKGLTNFLWSNGDTVTRLDRNEPTLNENREGDVRDTTTPDAMAATMQHFLLGDALRPSSRDQLIRWMEETSTGLGRLRAGLPKEWRVGDKTGTCGARGAAGDLAILWPKGRGPVLIASYLSDSAASYKDLDAAHAAIGRLVAEMLQ